MIGLILGLDCAGVGLFASYGHISLLVNDAGWRCSLCIYLRLLLVCFGFGG